jgi:lysophospholipase L1-like esterase
MFKLQNLAIYLLLNIVLNFSLACSQQNPNPERFKSQIEQFQQWDSKNSLPENYVLFIGSSSIRMWETADAFPNYNVVNRGFGGAHISDMLYYIDDIILKHKSPNCVVFYCGDNDISGNKPPERIFDDYVKFVSQVHQQHPHVPFIYIPAKPSLKRWNLWNNMKVLNDKIRTLSDASPLLYYADIVTPMMGKDDKPLADLFIKDGLHLSKKGYSIWNEIIHEILEKINQK